MSLFADLTARGLIEQCSDPDLAANLDGGGLSAYAGFDPTAPSLHLGSLMPILGLMRLQRAGHRPIALVGGATGMIGDPSGKSEERRLLSAEDIAENCAGIRSQLERFLDFGGPKGAKLVNNADWFAGVSFREFLRDTGKHITVNMMFAKESVRARLEDRAHGISYTEFSYMLVQAYDFLWLHQHEACVLQIGGSDQWGNITAGIELIRRKRAQAAYGLTLPLITTADGKKFGKTEAGNIWLDGGKSSPYQMFQFFLNTDDRDVVRLINYFTFLPRSAIEELAHQVATAPELREAQRVLAREVTRLVHGAEEAARAEQGAGALFGGGLEAILAAPTIPASNWRLAELEGGLPLGRVLSHPEVKLAASGSAARRDIEGGGVYVNEQRVADPGAVLSPTDLQRGQVVLLRKGKKSYHLLRFA